MLVNAKNKNASPAVSHNPNPESHPDLDNPKLEQIQLVTKTIPGIQDVTQRQSNRITSKSL